MTSMPPSCQDPAPMASPAAGRLHWVDVLPGPVQVLATDCFVDGQVRTGELVLPDRRVPIREGIARFVPDEDYASNFGRQWNEFRLTQLDSHTGLPLSFNRFWNTTRWKPLDLRGKLVLEAGSGAGRFTEILLEAGARVVSFDLSRATDANLRANRTKGELLLAQASIYEMPFPDNHFDYVFCHGVLQHTPDPDRAYAALFRTLKPGGRISIDYYLRLPGFSEWTTQKYLWRPLTSKMNPERLLSIIRTYIPLWLPVDTFLRRLPLLGHPLRCLLCVPCWNYHDLPLPREAQVDWSIMDTYDALGARYDTPKTREEVRQMVDLPGANILNVDYGGNGVVANVAKI